MIPSRTGRFCRARPGWDLWLVDVEVDSEKEQRPEQDGEHGRTDPLQRVEMGVVVVRGRDDRADDEVDEGEKADSPTWARAGSRWVVRHERSLVVCSLQATFPSRRSAIILLAARFDQARP